MLQWLICCSQLEISTDSEMEVECGVSEVIVAPEDWHDDLHIIRKSIREHINPLAALGIGFRSLADKVRVLAFTFATPYQYLLLLPLLSHVLSGSPP